MREQEYVQHDIQELNRFLFENIEEHMPGAGARIIPELYRGTTTTEVIILFE